MIPPFRSAFRLFLVVTISFPGHQFQLDSDRSYRSCPLLFCLSPWGKVVTTFFLLKARFFQVSFWLLESYIGSSGYPCSWMLVRPRLESRGGNISHIQTAELVGRGFFKLPFQVTVWVLIEVNPVHLFLPEVINSGSNVLLLSDIHVFSQCSKNAECLLISSGYTCGFQTMIPYLRVFSRGDVPSYLLV